LNSQIIDILSSLDDSDKELLNEIQWTFPLVTRPFDAIAKKFDTTPEIIKEKLTHLKEIGVLRQLSAIFDTRKLGYTSSLVAMEIESDKLNHVANQINRHPGVSHNYERDHNFNLWFTLAVPPGTDFKTELEKFNVLPGIKKVRMLPTIQFFKIGVKLDMVDGKKREIAPTEEKKEIKNIQFIPTEQDKNFIRELQKDMEIIDEPFIKAAKNLGVTEEELFEKMKYYETIGVLRRFAAILRHRKVGFTANGMIVWKVPQDRIKSVGETLGSFPQISHCYERPTYEDWPYNVFSMIHCKTHDEANDVAKTIQNQIDVDEYRILFSSREFKKTRVEYFVENSFKLEDSAVL